MHAEGRWLGAFIDRSLAVAAPLVPVDASAHSEPRPQGSGWGEIRAMGVQLFLGCGEVDLNLEALIEGNHC
jgi:hypothetical protein